jgi:uncharacterized membrane protein YebE (DUF533 family)
MDINRLLEGVLGQTGVGQTGAGQAGAGQATAQGQAGGPVKDILGNLSGSLGGMPGALAGGAAAGGLMALLLGSEKARKIGGRALTYGGLAAVGVLAYKAWSDYKAKRPGAPAPVGQLPEPPAGSAFDLASQRDRQGGDLRLALVQALISASNADGHIDRKEHGEIQERIRAMDLAADEKAFLFDQLNAPSDPIAVARLARGEEQAAEIYLASALAIDVDTPQEQRYLERLADALHLPQALRAELDKHALAAKAGGAGDAAFG